MIERCIRCHEKLTESTLAGYRERFAANGGRVGGSDDEFLLTDPHGRVILWLRCSICLLLRPTTRVWRSTRYDPYVGDRGVGERPGSPPPGTPASPTAPHEGGEKIPWWAVVLGLSSVPRQRAAALRLVKHQWRRAAFAHHNDRTGSRTPEHYEAFLRKRAAYDAALKELSR